MIMHAQLGLPHIHLPLVDSTMAYAKSAVHEGRIIQDTVITAEKQLSGKGRWGRNWISPPGCLAYTRVLPQHAPLQPIDYSMLSALSLSDALHHFGLDNHHIKWPNDLVVEEKKIAGILIERFEHHVTQWISIGIGVNVNCPSDELKKSERPTTSLASLLGHTLSMEEFLHALVACQNDRLKKTLDSLDLLQKDWSQALSWMIGTVLTTHRGTLLISGKVCSILEDGSIVLQTEGNRFETLSKNG